MVRGRDALYGHQRRLQLSRYQRSDFGERFAKLRLHASAALAVSRPARVGDIPPATRAASLLTLDLSLQGWASAHPYALCAEQGRKSPSCRVGGLRIW